MLLIKIWIYFYSIMEGVGTKSTPGEALWHRFWDNEDEKLKIKNIAATYIRASLTCTNILA